MSGYDYEKMLSQKQGFVLAEVKRDRDVERINVNKIL